MLNTRLSVFGFHVASSVPSSAKAASRRRLVASPAEKNPHVDGGGGGDHRADALRAEGADRGCDARVDDAVAASTAANFVRAGRPPPEVPPIQILRRRGESQTISLVVVT